MTHRREDALFIRLHYTVGNFNQEFSMSLTPEAVQKIAHLARLTLSENETALYTPQLDKIFHFIELMDQTDTTNIEPMAHPVEISQRLRPDTITEPDLREKFQRIAPQVEAGLYLVPKVIEEA
jgi:aspartyl-tRNA(Asn)/glutamyl-tRNA(Gln) amidotransferase subunit C